MSATVSPQSEKSPSVSSDQYDSVKQDLGYVNAQDHQDYLNPMDDQAFQPVPSNPGPGLPPPRTLDRAPPPPTRDISISSGTGSEDAFRMSPTSPDTNKNNFNSSIGRNGAKTKVFRKDIPAPVQTEKVIFKQKNSAFDSGKTILFVRFCLFVFAVVFKDWLIS